MTFGQYLSFLFLLFVLSSVQTQHCMKNLRNIRSWSSFTFSKQAISPRLLILLLSRDVLLTLFSAGAAHIQDNVFLRVDSDKVTALEGQVTSWKVRIKKKPKTNKKDNLLNEFVITVMRESSLKQETSCKNTYGSHIFYIQLLYCPY